jgi:hypothetical protein
MLAVAFWLCVNGRGEVMFRSNNRALVAGWRRIIGARVVPVFRKWVNEAAGQQKRKQKPAAWVAFATDGSESSAVYSLYEQARAAADEWNWDVAPLYAGPTLTDEEREAIERAIGAFDGIEDVSAARCADARVADQIGDDHGLWHI